VAGSSVGVAVTIGRDGAVPAAVGEAGSSVSVGSVVGDAAASPPVGAVVAVAAAVASVVAVGVGSSSSPLPQAASARTSKTAASVIESHLVTVGALPQVPRHRVGANIEGDSQRAPNAERDCESFQNRIV
jgi:hypothetical protein